VGKKENMANHR